MKRLALFLALSACGPATPAHLAPASLRDCPRAGRVTSITGAVDRLNALPPTGPACFLASLPRPLAVVASTSITSAQPSPDRDTPRFFLLDDAMVISFVPAGDGAHLVEFGQWMSPTRTLKGEVSLPRDGELASDAPFTRVHYSQPATTCGLCHRDEQPHPSLPGAYVSLAFRPATNTLTPLSTLHAAHDTCTRDEDPSERCLLFHALFDFGAVTQGAFSSEVPLFVE